MKTAAMTLLLLLFALAPAAFFSTLEYRAARTRELEMAVFASQLPERSATDAAPRRDNSDGLLGQTVPRLELQFASMPQAAQALRKLGFRMCDEDANFLQRLELPQGQRHKARLDERKFISITLENEPLANVLDKLVQQDDAYFWERVPQSDVINIVPKRSALHWELSYVHWKNRRLGLVYDMPELAEHGIQPPEYLFGPLRSPTYILNRPVSVRARQIRFRDFLNMLVDQHASAYWKVSSTGSLWFFCPPE